MGIIFIPGDHEISRFGLCVENGNLKFAINELKKIKNVKIVGLHAHFSLDREV